MGSLPRAFIVFFIAVAGFTGLQAADGKWRIDHFRDILGPKLVTYILADQDNNVPGAIASDLNQLTEDEKYIRPAIFSEEDWPAVEDYFNLSFREAKRRLLETKVLSNNTWFVFDSKTGRSVFAKSRWENDRLNIGATKILKSLESQMKKFGIKFIYEYSPNDSIIFRPSDFITQSPYQVYPLHGIFSGISEKFAKAMGLKNEEWISREYVPILASIGASLHYIFGVHGQLHTQNLLLEVDDATGKISGLHARDHRDMAFDPEIQAHQFAELELHQFQPRRDLLDLELFDFAKPDSAEMTAAYFVAEDIGFITTDEKLRKKLTHEFIWKYAEEVARIMDLQLDRKKLEAAEQSMMLPEFPMELFLRLLDRQVRQKIRTPLVVPTDRSQQARLRHLFEESNATFNTDRIETGTWHELGLKVLPVETVYGFDDGKIWKLKKPLLGAVRRDEMTIVSDPSVKEELAAMKKVAVTGLSDDCLRAISMLPR